MWFFASPQVIYGEQALSYLERLPGKHACIVTAAADLRMLFLSAWAGENGTRAVINGDT